MGASITARNKTARAANAGRAAVLAGAKHLPRYTNVTVT